MEEITYQLIQQAASGNQEAITKLYELTYNSVYKTVKAMIQDEDTVLDIVQDSYIKGFQSLLQLDAPENYRAWMKRIATNKARDYLKKKKPVLFSEMMNEDGEEIDFRDECLDHCPEEIIDQKETTRLMKEILDTLSEEQRLVIGMFYYEEMTVREIAEALDCSENTVKSRLNYGRKKIEVKVRDLEKRGTKLYSLAPLPFLLWLFRMDAQAAEVPSGMVLDAITASCSGSGMAGTASTAAAGAKTATGAVASTGAKAAAGTAAKALSTKVVAGVLAATVAVGGGTMAAVSHAQKKAEVPQAAVVATEATLPTFYEEVPEETPAVEDTVVLQNDHSIYDGILADFERRFQNQEGFADGRGNAYGYYDLNGDGRDELLIADTYTDETGALKVYTVCGIYAVVGEEPMQIAEGWSRNTYTIYEDGLILNVGSSGQLAGTTVDVLQLNGSGELEKTIISPDDLGKEAQIAYTQLQQEETTWDHSLDDVPYEGFDENNLSFEEILSELENASKMPLGEYDALPEHYNEKYSYLGNGMIWLLLHREFNAYTYDFYYREYDIDNDGENELLFARGISPSRVEPLAIYNLGEEPITGDLLYNYSFPNDANSDYPQWNYAF